jgi:hypothetical protein
MKATTTSQTRDLTKRLFVRSSIVVISMHTMALAKAICISLYRMERQRAAQGALAFHLPKSGFLKSALKLPGTSKDRGHQ